LVAATKLGVAGGARLVSVALAGLDRDPERLTLTQFLAATPTATHKGVLAVSTPGTVVALIRKGMRLTRERYVADPYPEAWVPMKELRPAERCVVRAAAFRGYRAPPPEFPGVSGTPPCVWLLLELLDPGMIVPHDRRTKLGRAASANAAAREGPRLVCAPMFAGGDVTEYVVGWDAYAAARDRPWAKGARIQMLFEDMTRGVDPDAPGAMKQSGFEPAPGAAPNAEEKGEGPGPGPAEPAAGDAASPAGAGTTLGAASEASGKEEPEPEPGGKESKPGVLKAPNGAELFIGTVSRVKGGDDPWENTQVVFDSDPAQE
jgi:hypothetical protein